MPGLFGLEPLGLLEVGLLGLELEPLDEVGGGDGEGEARTPGGVKGGEKVDDTVGGGDGEGEAMTPGGVKGGE